MKSIKVLSIFLVALFFFSCSPARKATTGGDDGILEFQILQMNDVYEISPTASDNIGGLARVATIRKELLAKNPNTLTVLAGDFISPSVIGTLKYEGKRIRGKQMVETLNTLGLDWVVFGNHEFDYDDLADLQARLDESKFTWLAANARLKAPLSSGGGAGGGVWTQQFFKNKAGGGTEICPDNKVIALKDADGTSLNLGLFGVLVNSGKKPWVEYSDWAEAAKKNYAELKPKCDVVFALTHLAIEDDKKLAAMIPQIPLVLGGHDHDNMRVPVGPSVVTKADANAKTVYIHTIRYDKRKKTCTVKSELKKVNSSIADEPATAAVVAKWEKIKNESLSSSGFNADAVVTKLEKPLDCREAIVRHSQAPVGAMITEAMLTVSRTKPECALLNSGSIRVDDVLSGTLTELDIVRMLPFGGGITEVEMKGSLLRKTLETGLTNKGSGGFLQFSRLRRDEATGKWFVGANALDDNKLYRVALPDFLLTGNEANMGFLKASLGADGKSDNPDIPKIMKPDPKDKSDLRNDVRLALIKYLRGE
ncbi:MAG: bifunctional metallophosphatase/5'-nucleotidase [Phycisphaerae bacterium]|nr:bifunctional metallophosphatase/5'-nucleotidase [Saprospiraceae bacterium]